MKRRYTSVPSVLSSIPMNIRNIAKASGVVVGPTWTDVDLLNLHNRCYFFDECDEEIVSVLGDGGPPDYDHDSDAPKVETSSVFEFHFLEGRWTVVHKDVYGGHISKVGTLYYIPDGESTSAPLPEDATDDQIRGSGKALVAYIVSIGEVRRVVKP